MSMTTGVTHYTCDRCKKEQYVEEGDTASTGKWFKRLRIGPNGEEINRWMCETCNSLYTAFVEDEQLAFNKFMRGE